jgi:hypothetical protein
VNWLKLCRICLLLAIGMALGITLGVYDTGVVSPYSLFGAIGLTLAGLISLLLSLP